MSDSYDQVLTNVSKLLAGYPTEDKLFRSTQKFVLFLRYATDFQVNLYDYLVDKADKRSDKDTYRMLVPSKHHGFTFVFAYFSQTPKTIAEELADSIYLKKVILKKRLVAKLLCKGGALKCPDEFQNLCNNCLGLMDCGVYPTRPCFKKESLGVVSKPEDFLKFLKFLVEELKFETINLKTIKWEVPSETKKTVIGYFNEFNKDVASFARHVCDLIAPNHSYENITDITWLNNTYVRFQATNSFRFIKQVDVSSAVIQPADYLYVPDNLEEVFQQTNESTAGIDHDWQRIIAMTKIIDELKHLRGPVAGRQLMNMARTKLDDIRTNLDLYLHIDEKTQELADIQDRIIAYQKRVDHESDMFKDEVANKFEDITANLIRSIVAMHGESFSWTLNKLNEWLNQNLQNITISVFFKHLNKKVEQYFSYSNAYMINSWFLLYGQRVPHDWQARLAGFGRSDQYWLMPEYEIHELEKTIAKEDMEFSEYVDILEYYLRESFEFLVDDFESCIQPKPYNFLVVIDRWKFEGLAYTKNFTHFFGEWKQIAGSRVPLSSKGLLQVKYEQSFGNISLETVRPIIQNSVKRAVLFMRDNLDFIENKPDRYKIHRELHFHNPKVKSIYTQFQVHARPLYEAFKKGSMDRVVQNMVRLESSNIAPALDRLSRVLTEFLKLQYDDSGLWEASQPYRRMVSLKYSMIRYEDFLRDTKIIFEANDLEIPGTELKHLESVRLKFENLQKQAELSAIEGRINTRWNWGQGFRSGEKNVANIGVRSVTSAVEEASFLIFLFWCLVLLFKNGTP